MLLGGVGTIPEYTAKIVTTMKQKKVNIEAIIFDWGRTLFDSEEKKEFPESRKVVELCNKKGYKLAVASLVTHHANATLEERKNQIENSILRKHFKIVAVTDVDKNIILDEIVLKLKLPREKILIVDDRVIRGVKYGNEKNHPTVWLKKGKFENESPNLETGNPTFTIKSLDELLNIV